MKVLPRRNLPLCPPPNYFRDVHSMISNFIWDGRRPRIRLSTLQRPKLLGGLAVPNFELYYWSFQMRALSKWVDPHSTTAWRMIESAKVLPHRLQDILFSSVTNKTIKITSGLSLQTLYRCGRKLNVGWAVILNFVTTCHYGRTQGYYVVPNHLFNHLGHL